MCLKSVSVQNQAAKQEHLGKPLCTLAWEDRKSLLQNTKEKTGFPHTAQEEGQAVTSQVSSTFNF